MAGETLLDASQLLAAYPDNTAGLIDALEGRNFIVSSGDDVGFAQEIFTPVPASLAPTTVLADTLVNSVWVAPTTALRFWNLDGNNAFVNDYAPIIVNAGTDRLVNYDFAILAVRQPPVTPLQFGGNYQIIHSDGAPGAGDVALHSNLTQMRVHYTDDDANDLTAEWQSMAERDIVNIAGVLYKIDSPPVHNASDAQFTFLPLQRQAASSGADVVFVQGFARDDDVYEFGIFAAGVQIGPSFFRSIGDSGDYIEISFSEVRDIQINEPIDLRVAKTLAGDPNIDVLLFVGNARGTLI